MMKSLQKQKGAEVVEFAIVSSLLFLILFGIIEFSVALFDKAVLTNASREGARTGILFRPPDPDLGTRNLNEEDAHIEQVIRDYASANLISLGGVAEMLIDIRREPDHGDVEPEDEIFVTVSYSYQYLILPSFIGTLGGALNLSSTTVMRAE